MLFFLFGCLSGSSYPNQLASATCKTAFKCVSQDELEDYFGYKNIGECISDIEEITRNDSSYKAWEEGDKDFNKENAEECLAEIYNVQSDSDCTGSMNIFSFIFDITASECMQIYE